MRALRRTLRDIPGVRRAFYRVRSALTKKADPYALRLVDEDAFRSWLHWMVHFHPPAGAYVEFGVFNGLTLSIAHEVMPRHVKLYGFDSFQGVPKDVEGLYLEGMCKCDLPTTLRFLNERNVDWNRLHLIEGWFADTLTAARQKSIGKASYVMVDCDLYESAALALTFVEPLIEDSAILIFDDWHGFQAAERGMGERRAFEEFLVRFPHFDVIDLPAYSHQAMAFKVTRR
ncbi:MAG: TylF/MycF/NovP-related O-methyltransferase [Methyloceanibacter sp.]